MKNLDAIWKDLESNPSPLGNAGYDYAYFDTEQPAVIRVGLDLLKANRLLLLEVSETEYRRFNRVFAYNGIALGKIRDTSKGPFWLALALTRREYTGVFTALSEDIIEHVAPLVSEREQLLQFIERLEAWRRLFENVPLAGLSREKQLGLWGELYVLHSCLIPRIGSRAVSTWHGPEHATHDFQSGSWAIEVKSTASNPRPEQLKINGERQLDDSGLEKLYLIMVAVSRLNNGGLTLPQLVDQIREALSGNPVLRNHFTTQLLEAGYDHGNREQYESVGYHIRKERIWSVSDDFPKLTENHLPPGINQVTYSLSISAIAPYERNFDELDQL